MKARGVNKLGWLGPSQLARCPSKEQRNTSLQMHIKDKLNDAYANHDDSLVLLDFSNLY